MYMKYIQVKKCFFKHLIFNRIQHLRIIMVHPFLRFLWTYKKILIVLLTPILLLPLPLVSRSTEASCGFVIILMATYWITEALPLAVTSLIPLILFPLTGILKAGEVAVLYFKDTNWLMFGGLMIAVAVETSGLHKRIALRVLLLVGVKPRRLMFGFMSVTFFLSMWISNTATTAMLIPIVEAIVKELYESDCNVPSTQQKERKQETSLNENAGHDNLAFEKTEQQPTDSATVKYVETGDGETDNPTLDSIQEEGGKNLPSNNLSDKRKLLIIKGMTICIPYAASIGGTASLTGTVPNLVLSGQYEEIFPQSNQKLSFGVWIIYCLPQAVVTLLLAYLWLSIWFIGFKDLFSLCKKGEANESGENRAKQVIKEEYEKLGKISWAEISVLVVFILTALLWFFRDPGYMTGWSIVFLKGYISDGTVAVTMAFLLFFLPRSKPEFINTFKKGKRGEKYYAVPAILDWPTAQRMFPWDVTLLLGAGFGIAGAATKSGLSAWLGQQLAGLKGIDDWVICLTMTTFICLMTETTSNTATSSLFVPILAELAKVLEIHPLYLLLPPIVAASFAFMLPVATPPNAIAFSYGRISVWDLVKAGWMVNIIGILVLTLSINTFGVAFFNLKEFPEWANTTLSSETSTTTTPCLSMTTLLTTT